MAGEVDLAAGAAPQDFVDGVERRAPNDEEGEPLAQAFVIPFSGDGMQPALDAGAIGLWASSAVVALLALTILALALARQSEAMTPELRRCGSSGWASPPLSSWRRPAPSMIGHSSSKPVKPWVNWADTAAPPPPTGSPDGPRA